MGTVMSNYDPIKDTLIALYEKKYWLDGAGAVIPEKLLDEITALEQVVARREDAARSVQGKRRSDNQTSSESGAGGS